MAFTYTKVNFLNDESYNEIKHSIALANGWPNFIVDGFDYDEATKEITNGRGMNGGLPVILGRDGETQTIPTDGTNGYIVLVSKLAGIVGSVNTIEMRATKETIIDGIQNEFPLYSIDPATGEMLEDYRHSAFIKDVYFEDLGDDTFRLVINGTWSSPFRTSVFQNAYTKSESDRLFKRKVDLQAEFSDSDFVGMNAAQIFDFINNYMSEWQYSYEVEGDSGDSAELFPNVYTAIRNLITTVFKQEAPTTSLTFNFNRMRTSSENGGDTLEVGFDNGDRYHMQYDNYGTDWQTVDADAFRPLRGYYGASYFAERIIGQNIRLDYEGATSIEASGATVGIVRTPVRETWKTTGINAFQVQNERSGSSSTDWITYITSYNTAGAIRSGLRMRANMDDYSYGAGKSFAYQSTRIADKIATLETEAELQRQIDLQKMQIEALVNNEEVPTEYKQLKVKSKALNDVETKLYIAQQEYEQQIKNDKEIYLTDNIKFGKEAQEQIGLKIAEFKKRGLRNGNEEKEFVELQAAKQELDSILLQFEQELEAFENENQ